MDNGKVVEKMRKTSRPASFYRQSFAWVGEIQLPTKDERLPNGSVFIKLLQTPRGYRNLVGKRIRVALKETVDNKRLVDQTNVSVRLDDAAKRAILRDCILPVGVDGWSDVSPLESLAASLEHDGRNIVGIDDAELHTEGSEITLYSERTPVSTAGSQVALVKFMEAPRPNDASKNSYRILAQHYDPVEKTFVGPIVEISYRQGVFWRKDDCQALPIDDVYRSRLNDLGYYVFGKQTSEDTFEMASLVPREPFIIENQAMGNYKSKLSCNRLMRIPGRLNPEIVEFTGSKKSKAGPKEAKKWREGERGIILHLFGGYESSLEAKRDDFSFGHLSFGVAEAIKDQFTGELKFKITYSQLYTNTNSHILSCRQDWSFYMGGLAGGVFYALPVWDVFLSLPGLDRQLTNSVQSRSFLDVLESELEKMMAYYRVGNGNGYMRFSINTSCVQDSFNSLYVAIQRFHLEFLKDAGGQISQVEAESLKFAGSQLRKVLESFGSAPRLWVDNLLGRPLHERKTEKIAHIGHAIQTYKFSNTLSAFLSLMKSFEKSGDYYRVFKSSQFGVEQKTHRATPPVNLWHYLVFELQYDSDYGGLGPATVIGAVRRYSRNFFRFALA